MRYAEYVVLVRLLAIFLDTFDDAMEEREKDAYAQVMVTVLSRAKQVTRG